MKRIFFSKTHCLLWIVISLFAALPAMANPSKVDVAVLYSPNALRAAGSIDKMETQIYAWVNHTNQVYKNSDVQIELSAVVVREVDFNEYDEAWALNTGDALLHLADPSTSIGGLTKFVAEASGADIVFLVFQRDGSWPT